jgi:hypothetical protein
MDTKALITLAKQTGIKLTIFWCDNSQCPYCKGDQHWLDAFPNKEVISPAGEVFTHKVKVELGWACFRCDVKKILGYIEEYKQPRKPIEPKAYEDVLTILEQQCQALRVKLGKPLQAGPYR